MSSVFSPPLDRERLFRGLSERSPWSILCVALRAALHGLNLSLYLHRVAKQKRPSDHTPGLTIDPDALDAVLEELAALPRTHTTVSFDDGYVCSRDYIDARAPRWPALQFAFYVCPQKLERRAGFRWDLYEKLALQGRTPALPLDAFLVADADIARENDRADLRGLCDEPMFAMVSVDQAKDLTRHRNVVLGNHSNCHLPLSKLSAADSAAEIAQSTADFVRLFGPAERFAFPFGYPHAHFGEREVQALRAHGYREIWSTKESPYPAARATPGAVMPRVQLLGTWSPKHMLLWVIHRALVYRARSVRGHAEGSLFPL